MILVASPALIAAQGEPRTKGTPTPARLRDAGNLERRINDCDASFFVR